jgi:hypothetical protein
MTSTRRRPTVRVFGHLCLLTLTLTLSLAACGGSPDPAPAAPAVPPAQYQVPVDQLPDGWRVSNPSGDGYRTTFCGVDMEPTAPVDSAHYRFAKGPVGPFLEQHVRSYAGNTAAEVIGAIQTALPGCQEFEAAADESSPAVRFAVKRLTLSSTSASGPDTVAWQQEPADGSGVVSDVVLTRRGTTAVLLVAYSLRDEPDRAALTAALAAVRQ